MEKRALRHHIPKEKEGRYYRLPLKAPAGMEEMTISYSYDRSGNKVMTIGDGTPYCASGHNAVFCMDVNTKERRYANVQDVEEFGIISQWCESIDIVGVPYDATKEEIAAVFTDTNYSRLPVYKETMDHIVGIIYQKDFYNVVYDKGGNIESIIRPALYITESKKIGELLQELH